MTELVAVGVASGLEDPLSVELGAALAAACQDLGVQVRRVATRSDAEGLDAVVGIAYPDYYPFFYDPTFPARSHAWLGEPLPPADERLTDRLTRPLRLGRVVDALILGATLGRRRSPPPALTRWRERIAFRRDQTRNLGLVRAAARHGIGLVVTSRDRADSLARFGIVAPVIPFGYDAAFAGEPADPDLGRDIDVLVIGTAIRGVPTRRARITAEALAGLAPSVRTLVVEGGTWGGERSILLRRARIVLNVQRVPGNFTGLRSVLAGAAGALVVSEPVTTPEPFVPGVHYVEAPAARLAATIHEVLADRPRRLAIARAAQALVVEELTMRRSAERLLAAIG